MSTQEFCENCHWLTLKKGDLELGLEMSLEHNAKLLTFVLAFDNWNEKRQEHIMIASRAWDAVEAARKALNEHDGGNNNSHP